MPTALADYRTRIRNMLVDTLAARYPNTQVDEALRQVLTEYSETLPQVLTGSVTVSAAGRDQALSALTNPKHILKILYPYTAAADPDLINYPAWYSTYTSGSPMVHMGGDSIPQVGQVLYVIYAAPHTIKDLDSATLTTIMPQHDTYITIGAAGLCALQRGSSLIEAFTSRSSDVAQLLAFGNMQLNLFRRFLASMKDASYPPGNLSGQWSLD